MGDVCDGGRRKKRLDIDVPFSGKPCQRLQREYRTSPYECPLRASDVFIVSLVGEVNGEEHGPYEEKWPDIGTEEQGKGIV